MKALQGIIIDLQPYFLILEPYGYDKNGKPTYHVKALHCAMLELSLTLLKQNVQHFSAEVLHYVLNTLVLSNDSLTTIEVARLSGVHKDTIRKARKKETILNDHDWRWLNSIMRNLVVNELNKNPYHKSTERQMLPPGSVYE